MLYTIHQMLEQPKVYQYSVVDRQYVKYIYMDNIHA